MAQVIIPGIAAAVSAGTATVGQLFIFGAVNLGVSTVASYALSALAPKPDIPGSGGFLVNEVNPVAPAEYVYGEVRKGGVVTYDEATDGNAILHRIIVLGAGQYEVGDIYLNDEVVTLSNDAYSMTDPSDPSDVYEGAGWVLTEKWMEDNAVREPRIRIFVHDGSQTAATDTFANSADRTLANELIAKSANGLDANFVGKGLTYLYVQMNIDAEVFAGGIPRITAMVKGEKVYDPRTDTTVWSDNWALCAADYLQTSKGLGDANSVDDTALSAEANICDEDVTLDAGGTQKRYRMNGVFSADEQPGQILARMMPSGSGNLSWSQGKWNIRAGAYAGSVASFGLSDLRSGISVQTRAPRSQNYNAIRGVFNDASQRYIEGEYPQISSATFLAEDGGFENVLEYDLPFETDGVRAQRLAKLALYRQREQIKVEADFSMRAAEVAIGDVIDLTIDRYGWTAKEFEVVGWRLKISESGTVCVRLSLKETSEASYDWDAEETVFTANNTTLPDYRVTATVVIGAPSVQQVRNPGGTELPLVIVPITVTDAHLAADYVFQWRENTLDYAANGGFVELGGTPTAREDLVYAAYLRILYRVPDQDGFDYYVSGAGSALTEAEIKSELAGSTEGQNQAQFQSVVTTTPQGELRALQVGKRYDLRVVSRNALGIVSPSSTTTYLIEADADAPPVPTHTGRAITLLDNQVTVRWNNPPTDGAGNPVYDREYTEIHRNTSNTTVGATLLGVSTSNEYIDTDAAWDTTYYYFLRAKDFAGNYSAFDAGREVVIGSEPASGTDGKSVYTAIVFRRSASAPSTPSGGSFNFGTNTLTPPSGWFLDVPAGSDPIYGTRFVFSISGDTGTASGGTWSTPFKIAEDGVDGFDGTDGADGLSTFIAFVYKRATSTPSTPTGGSYNFTTNTLTVPSGWSGDIPSGTDPLYRSTATASITGVTGTDSSLTWTTPKLFVQNGAAGDAGARGAGRWHVSTTGFSGLPVSSAGAQGIWNANAGFAPVVGDQAWFYTGTLANPTSQAVFICATVSSPTSHTWTLQNEVIDGNLLVTGTGTFDKLVVNSGIFQDDGSGGLDIITGSMTKIQVGTGGGALFGSALTPGSWTEIHSESFTVTASGDLMVRCDFRFYAYEGSGSDPALVFTDYCAPLFRLRLSGALTGTFTAGSGSQRVTANNSSGFEYLPSIAVTSGRSAGTLTCKVDADFTRTNDRLQFRPYTPRITIIEAKK